MSAKTLTPFLFLHSSSCPERTIAVMQKERLNTHPSGLLVTTNGDVFQQSPRGDYIKLARRPYITLPGTDGVRISLRKLVAETFIPNPHRHPYVIEWEAPEGALYVDRLAWSANTMGLGMTRKSTPVVAQDAATGEEFFVEKPYRFGVESGFPNFAQWICHAISRKGCSRGFRFRPAREEDKKLPHLMPLHLFRRTRIIEKTEQEVLS